MAKIKRIVTSQVDGRNLSDFYGDNSYVFDTTGQINYYGENKMGPVIEPGIVYGSNNDSGDGYGYNTIKLVPHAPGGDINDDRYLIIDPTAPNHIHIRAGGNQDASNAELILGAEKTYVKVNDSQREVRISSRQQQQVMAHLNLNSQASDTLLTGDVVSAIPGWTVEVNGIMYYIQDVQVGEGTTIYAPGAQFQPNGVYNVFSPDYTNEWTFDSDGVVYGPMMGRVAVAGVVSAPNSNLDITAENNMTVTATNGDMNFYMDGGMYIGNSASENQIIKRSELNNAVPQDLGTDATPTFDKIIVSHNSEGTNIQVGDDAFIGDVDEAGSIAIIGLQDPTTGGIILGNDLSSKISTDGYDLKFEANSGDMNFWMDGGMYIGPSESGNQIIRRSDLDSYVSPIMVRYNPTFAATGLTFTGSGETHPTYNSYYTKAGKMVSFVIEVDCSTVTNFGTGQYTLQLPFQPAIGYNHFSGWANVDTAVNPDVANGHVILNVDHAGITDVLDLHYLKQAGGAHTPIIEGLFLQGTPVTLTTSSKIYVNGTYICQ